MESKRSRTGGGPDFPREGELAAILFDLDGTLIDSGALYSVAYAQAMKELLDPPPSYRELLALRPASEREPLLRAYGEELGGRVHARMCDLYEALAPARFGGAYEGVEEMLGAVIASGLRVGVVTGKGDRCLAATRGYFNLERFEVILGEDQCPAPKPDPRGIHMALEALGVSPARALYLGDTPMDVEASLAAGVRPAAALWSRPPDKREAYVERILELAPAARGALFLRTPGELLDALGLA